MPFDFNRAAAFKMPFGKYKGQELDKIAMTDEGLRYLDWLYGSMDKPSPTMESLAAYLGDEGIQRELEILK